MRWFRYLRRREDLARDVREEIRFYLEMRAQELMDAGMPPAEAWRTAVQAFGDPERIEHEVISEVWRRTMWNRIGETAASLAQDVRYAVRGFRREAGFTLVAVVTLALGIGANTAIFSVAKQTLLRRPPVADADELAAVYTTSRRGFPRSSSSYPDYLDYRDRTDGLADLAATSLLAASLGTDAAGARLVTAQSVTGNYFSLLGLAPAAGRLLTPADDAFGGGSPVVVLSEALWRDHFAGDPGVVGSTVRLNGAAYDVVGVAPAGFRGLRLAVDPDLWIPMQSLAYLSGDEAMWAERFSQRGARWMDLLVGRLADGVSHEAARSALLALSHRLAEEDPDARGPRSVTLDALDGYILPTGSEADFRTFVLLLGGTVALALLLCTANLANLLLARASTRGREVGVRLAIGAGGRRVIRQLLTESLLLAVFGGLAGLAVAMGVLRVLGGFELPGGVPVAAVGASLDGGVLALTAGLSLFTGLLFGLAPATMAARTDLVTTLKSGTGRRGQGSGMGARKVLIAAQVALCLVLLVGSGLFLRTLERGLSTELGFQEQGLALTRFNLALLGYQPGEAMAFVEGLEERLAAGPGVAAVSTATRVPLQDGGARGTFFTVEGYDPAPDEELRVDLVYTTPGYVQALGQPLLAGRGFLASDGEGAEPVTIVNRAMAERYWPGGEAVGGHVLLGRTPIRVVGVVDNTTWNSLDDDVTSYMYLTLAQSPDVAAETFLTVAVRTSRDPEDVLVATGRAIAELDADVSLSFQRSMESMVSGVLMPQRMGAVLLSAFGLLALVLSAVGIAGVVAYSVNRQRRDIGVRVALGATRPSVLRGVARGMAVPVAGGVVAGLVAADGLSATVERFMFGVEATDPLTYATISVGLVAVAIAATLLPARAAARVNPVEVLKAE